MTVYRLAAQPGAAGGWQDAEPLDQLDAALAAAAPGDEVLIGFAPDREAPVFWKDPVAKLRHGGSTDRPLRISFGVTGAAGSVTTPPRGAPAMLRLSGAGFPNRQSPDLDGRPFLVIADGASNFGLEGPVFHGSANAGFYRLTASDAPFRALRFSDIHASMAGRAIETERGARIDGLVLENCSAFGLVRGFARFRELSNAVLRNLDLDAGLVDGGGTSVCQILFVERGSKLRFEGIRMANAINAFDAEARGSSYIQGDGLVCEEDTSDIMIRDCHARNMGDGGFDLKTDGVVLTDCSATGCKYGMRIWRQNDGNLLDRCAVTAPRVRPDNAAACLWIGGRATAVDCLLRAGPGADAIRFGEGPDAGSPRLLMRRGSIDYGASAGFLGGEPGELLLEEVKVNGELLTGRATWSGKELVIER